LSLCGLFAESTITKLKESAKSAYSILELEKCGNGISVSDGSVSIAALFLAINQFSSFSSILDFDKDGDGKFDIETSTSKASSDITAATDLNKLTTAVSSLTDAANFLTSDGFKWAFAQFKIIDAVIEGSSLPSDVKEPITKITTSLNASIDKINEYIDQGANAGASAGAKAQETAQKANEKADTLLSGQPENEKKESCQKLFCMRKSFNLGTEKSDLPANCHPYYDSLDKTCSQ
jgi:outer membrane murein-binding lipoprotein Lpp